MNAVEIEEAINARMHAAQDEPVPLPLSPAPVIAAHRCVKYRLGDLPLWGLDL